MNDSKDSFWKETLRTSSNQWKKHQKGYFLLFFLIIFLVLIFSFVMTEILYYFMANHSGRSFDYSSIGRFLNILCLSFFLPFSFWGIFILFPWLFLLNALKMKEKRRCFTRILQNALELNIPFPEVVRGWAAIHSLFYRRKLNRFAADLESGIPFAQASVRHARLFFPETVRLVQMQCDSNGLISLIDENMTQDENRSLIHSFAISRFSYLFLIAWNILLYFCFWYSNTHYLTGSFPWTDQILNMISSIIRTYHLSFIIPILLLIATIFFFFFIQIKLEISNIRPWFMRRFFRDSDSAKLLRFLSLGVENRISMDRILEVGEQVPDSSYLKRKINTIRKKIESGRSWIDALLEKRIVNRAEAAVLETAERTGNIAVMLREMARSRDAKQLRFDDLGSKILFSVGIIFAGFFILLLAICTMSATGMIQYLT